MFKSPSDKALMAPVQTTMMDDNNDKEKDWRIISDYAKEERKADDLPAATEKKEDAVQRGSHLGEEELRRNHFGEKVYSIFNIDFKMVKNDPQNDAQRNLQLPNLSLDLAAALQSEQP
jgi:hypothetical protein